MYLFTPEISEITTINVETDRMMPSNIRKERILCWRNVSSATPTGSRNKTPRFTTPRFIRTHPPRSFYAKRAWIVSPAGDPRISRSLEGDRKIAGPAAHFALVHSRIIE